MTHPTSYGMPIIREFIVNGENLVCLEKRDSSGELIQSFTFNPNKLSPSEAASYYGGRLNKIAVEQGALFAVSNNTLRPHPMAAPMQAEETGSALGRFFSSIGRNLNAFASFILQILKDFFGSAEEV